MAACRSIHQVAAPCSRALGEICCASCIRFISVVLIFTAPMSSCLQVATVKPFDPLEIRGNYSATSNNIKLVH